MVDDSLKYHLINARKNGIAKEEMTEIITHAAFLCRVAKCLVCIYMAKEVYVDDIKENHGGVFGMGEFNTEYQQYFIGKSYLKPLTNPNETKVFIANVTFEPGCRNNWHIHYSTDGGRTNFNLRRRRRLVSRRMKASTKFKVRRCSNNTSEHKTLARSKTKFMV